MGLHDGTHSYEDQRSITTGFLSHKHDLVVCAVGLRKVDKPSSLPAAHSNGKNSRKSQHKQSPAQEAQTRWMGGFCHHHPLQDEVNAFRFANLSSDTHRFGAPRLDYVEDEVDLLKNGDWRAAFLLYLQD
jgi:hypothetical protein